MCSLIVRHLENQWHRKWNQGQRGRIKSTETQKVIYLYDNAVRAGTLMSFVWLLQFFCGSQTCHAVLPAWAESCPIRTHDCNPKHQLITWTQWVFIILGAESSFFSMFHGISIARCSFLFLFPSLFCLYTSFLPFIFIICNMHLLTNEGMRSQFTTI